MPSPDLRNTDEFPPETAVGFLLSGLVPGVIAQDVVVGLLFFLLTGIAYLLYRILSVLELIATKL